MQKRVRETGWQAALSNRNRLRCVAVYPYARGAVLFGVLVVAVAMLLVHFGRPYRVPVFDSAVWVIACGYVAGLWGVGLSNYLLLWPSGTGDDRSGG
ncbi:MAG: hypothetical protein VW520_09415 [Candidatus Puniceispirillum sp.]